MLLPLFAKGVERDCFKHDCELACCINRYFYGFDVGEHLNSTKLATLIVAIKVKKFDSD